MKLACLADLHVGHRRYYKATKTGVNQRESDVAVAFRTAIDQVIERGPDAVLLAGDIYDSTRPSNNAMLFCAKQLLRLKEAGLPTVVLSGNHESPRTSEAGHPLTILREFGLHVAEWRREVFEFPGLTMTAIPHAAMTDPDLRLEPTNRSGYQVLLIHGDADAPRGYAFEEDEMQVRRVNGDGLAGWDHVCIGHYHCHLNVQGPVWYPGSLEYVSSNPWGELAEEHARGVPGKGWEMVDLEAGTVEFIPVPTRRHVDFPRFSANGLDGDDLLHRLTELIASVGGIEGAVARLVVTDVPRALKSHLDYRAIRQIEAPALHLKIDLRKADEVRQSIDRTTDGKRKTLTETVRDYFAARELPAGFDRADFERLGQEVLAQVEEGAAPVRERVA